MNPARPPAVTPDARIAARLAALERELASLTAQLNGGAVAQVPVVSLTGLPGGRLGRVVINADDLALYRDNGTDWVLIG